MTPDKWDQVKRIFQAAIALPDQERPDYVSQQCGADGTLLSEVNSLLASHSDSESLYETPAFEAISTLIETMNPPSRLGMVVGAYRIESEIGRGGMGAVYLASRADDAFDKNVAIKLIKRGLDTEEIIRRFRHERQILAGLDHPNITSLLDGGTTDDGLPFLVMEYIDGEQINRFADDRELNIKQRLEIFLHVCSAVSYAHKNLVIHRDLKPSNILVTAEGVPKLLDFGIAKLLAADGADQTIGLPGNPFQAMTPEYASPEQVNGQPVTTASDVYSLGVILFELLTGHRPFSFRARTAEEVSRVLGDTQPTKPSSLCRLRGSNVSMRNADSVARMLEGDLDNIVLMAMRKESDRRYSSVEQFAGDIRRFLDGLPVIAREDTFRYRTAKFIARNRAAVAAGGAIVLLVFAGIIGIYWQSRIAAAERDIAVSEAKRAERINDFLKKMLASADPRQQGKDIKMTEFLELAANSLEKDFSNEPEIIADLQTTIGLTFLSQGKSDQAEPHLRDALGKRIELFGADHHDVAISRYNYGQLLAAKGDIANAEANYRQALQTLIGLRGIEDLEVADVLQNLAYVLSLQDKKAEAIEMLRQVLNIRKKLLAKDHPDIAQALTRLGGVLIVNGELEAAEPLQRQAIEIMRQNFGEDHPDTAKALINLFAAVQYKDPKEAESLAVEALRIQRKLLGDEHPDVGWTLYNLSFLKMNQGSTAEAEEHARTILKMRGSSLTDEHVLVSSALLILGRSLMEQGKLSEAEGTFRECLELRTKTMAPDHWLLASTKGFIGEAMFRRGQKDAGRRLLLESYAVLKEKLGEEHTQTQMAASRNARLML